MAFYYGTKDKRIRYCDLAKFNKIGESTRDRLPIEKLPFDNSTNESLK